MTETPHNPYKPAAVIGDAPIFVGRTDVLRDVLRVLRTPQDAGIILYGQRRIGKTSILRELLQRLPAAGIFRPVYFDLLDKTAWPLHEIIQDLASVIAQQYQLPTPTLGPAPHTAFARAWLPNFFNNLPPGQSLVLLLDELGMLADPRGESGGEAFFPYLKALLAKFPGRVKFVAVLSRNLNDLDSVALQVLRGVRSLPISLLTQEDTLELVRQSEKNGTLHWRADALQLVWNLTHGHPLLAQLLCSEVWKRAYESEPSGVPVIEPAQVEAAIPQALEAGKHSIEWLWNGLPSAGRVVVAALAGAGARPIPHDELIQILSESGVRVVIRELETAPLMLQEWDLIESGPEPYRFRVELLRRWIVIEKPLARVKEELDYIEPLAESLYQAAARLYQNRQAERAVGLLRQAVEANPNHERASMLLSDILLSLGQHYEAQDLLENLYLLRPFAVWPRLARAFLAGAKAAPDEELALAAYQRILDVEPMHPAALHSKQQIWQRRAEAAVLDNRLEDALEAYVQAGMYEQAGKVETQLRRTRLHERLAELKRLDTEKQWIAGLALGQLLATEYPERNWEKVLLQFREKAELQEAYQNGLQALAQGETQQARRFLAEVAGRDPLFEEVTRYLHKAVSGVDVFELQQALDAARATLHSANSNVEQGALPPATLVAEQAPALPASPVATPQEMLATILDAARQGVGTLVGLPGKSDLLDQTLHLAKERGLRSFRSVCPDHEAALSYAAWHPLLQGIFEIDTQLPVEQQARQLRNRLVDIDISYIAFLSKISLVVLDVQVAGQTVLKLLSPQEMQSRVQEIIIDCIHLRSQHEPLLLVLECAEQMDPFSADLLAEIGQKLAHLPLVLVITYPQAGDLLPGGINALPHFQEITLES